ncbi:MAG: 50S ribosomal protein L6 [Spirochaetes bacterium]|nr:50S ribosomal protein L6 [Spirochaetota bacterium]
MSRIGKNPIDLPEGVTAEIMNNKITIKGPKGELTEHFTDKVKISKKENQIVVEPVGVIKKDKSISAYWGTARKLIQNLVDGVTNGFERKLILIGVGYRAAMQGNKLILTLGYSHPVEMEVPEGLKVQVQDNVNIIITGSNKYQVGQYAAVIREKRKPEPYKGKGLRYADEHIKHKVGKTGV